MKKCPTCDKTYEDSMRFCQADGTSLVDDQPPLDPYATMIGHKWDLTPSETVEEPVVETSTAMPEPGSATEPNIGETSGSVPIAEPDEVLDLPGVDPLRTMYVSDKELKDVLGGQQKPAESAKDERAADAGHEPGPGFNIPPPPTPPPSPFSGSDPEAATIFAPPFKDPEPARAAEWMPPASDTAWQDQQIGASMPFQPVSMSASAPSQGLAIGSLVCGILSCTICASIGLLLGPVAVLTGLMARKKSEENPSEFGGQGLALAGMITGAVGLLFGIVTVIYIIFVIFAVGTAAIR